MNKQVIDKVMEIFNVTDYSERCAITLAIDSGSLKTTKLEVAHKEFNKHDLQLLYNQYILRWFFGIPELTPYNWGAEVHYNSTETYKISSGSKYKTYTYNGLPATPDNVLYNCIDYYYMRECFRLYYHSYMSIVKLTERYNLLGRMLGAEIIGNIDSNAILLAQFFTKIISLLCTEKVSDFILKDMTVQDKQFLNDLQETFNSDKQYNAYQQVEKLAEIFKIKEDILNE